MATPTPITTTKNEPSTPTPKSDEPLSSSTRLQISDGKTLRSIWTEEDGNGDPNPQIFEKTRYSHDGHPTWKLYCGDAPKVVNGVLIEPPRFCYLDDAAAYRILNWEKYSKPYKGRCWRFDFGSKGEVRPHRPNRGRPAYLRSGEVAWDDGPSGRGKRYVFSGSGRKEELETLAEMRRNGLLEHRSVRVPVKVPGPVARNIHEPEMEPRPLPFGASRPGFVPTATGKDGEPPAKRSRLEMLLPGIEAGESANFTEGEKVNTPASVATDGVDRNVVDLAYYKELSKHLYSLNQSAAQSLDKIAIIDTIATQLRHEVGKIRNEQRAFRKRLNDLEVMMKKENEAVWLEMMKKLVEEGHEVDEHSASAEVGEGSVRMERMEE